MNSSNYNPNYYSLEDIIVTQERVPCSIETRLVGMGRITTCCVDPSTQI